MNKKIYSLILILSTVISCELMINSVNGYSSGEIKTSSESIINKNEKVILDDNHKTNTKSQQNNETISKSDTESTLNKSIKPVQQNNTEKSNQSVNTAQTAGGVDATAVDQITNQNEIALQNVTDSDDEDQQVTLDVFKVKKDDILNEMSFFDKEKLLLIGQKLSTGDLNKVENYLMNDTGGNGVINAFKLLKEKLCNKDYSKVKDIVKKFINIDVVEESNSKN